MVRAVSCGGVVIHKGKILLLYKNYKQKYEGWVLPKGTVEEAEDFKDTASREVSEEAGVSANIIKYIGKSQYSFIVSNETIIKDVHWYLMKSSNYYSKPQKEEFFIDAGYYKFHEAYHMLKFQNEKQILEVAYNDYVELKKTNMWGNKKY
ncbi:MAG: NUDIX domain-containing protein [Vallitaleaceae bacterium]|nr:NUDIX domain-containing protein [Vallitaleaceae bacterium]